MSVSVRDAGIGDAPVIADFNIRMAMETEGLRLDPAVITPGVEAIFGDPAKGTYFVAEMNGVVVGCLMLTHEWSDWRNGDIWWIQSVYVHPDYRRRGVFKALYRHVEALAREAGVVGLRLYVENHNADAQATYANLGMSAAPYRVMQQMFKHWPE